MPMVFTLQRRLHACRILVQARKALVLDLSACARRHLACKPKQKPSRAENLLWLGTLCQSTYLRIPHQKARLPV